MLLRVSLSSLVVLTSLLLVGCGEKERSAYWYFNHPEEMNKKLDECNNNAELQRTTNCLNALEALHVGVGGSIKPD